MPISKGRKSQIKQQKKCKSRTLKKNVLSWIIREYLNDSVPLSEEAVQAKAEAAAGSLEHGYTRVNRRCLSNYTNISNDYLGILAIWDVIHRKTRQGCSIQNLR